MIIFDAHLDLAWNTLDWNRDLLLPIAEIRRREQGINEKGRSCNTVCFPELRRGKVALFIATLLARVLRPNQVPAIQRYASMEAAYGAARGQMAYYRALEQQGHLRWIKDSQGLESHVREWTTGLAVSRPPSRRETASQVSDPPLGFILSMEGADPILFPEQVEEWWNAGLRIVGPAHYGISPYAHGTGTEGGLFPQGPALLKEMQRVGMILDVTHLSDQCFDEALDIYEGPVLASHHNCRALVPDQRQLTDVQIKRLIGRGAVIGMALDVWMLYPDWIRGQTTSEQAGTKLVEIVNHIDRVCQLAGDALHVGMGTDLDGGFGREQSPIDLDTIADLQRLPELLAARGYPNDAIEGILYKNWVRFFSQAWNKSNNS